MRDSAEHRALLREKGVRVLGLCVDDKLPAGLGVEALDQRHLGRGREVVDDRLQHVLDSLVLDDFQDISGSRRRAKHLGKNLREIKRQARSSLASLVKEKRRGASTHQTMMMSACCWSSMHSM